MVEMENPRPQTDVGCSNRDIKEEVHAQVGAEYDNQDITVEGHETL